VTVLGTLRCVVVLLVLTAMSCAAQQSGGGIAPALRRDSRAYLDLARDLESFVRSIEGRPGQASELERAMDLWRATAEVAQTCFAAASLVAVYDMIESPSDKRRVAPFVNDRLAEYAAWLDSPIKETNTALAKTQITDLATIADRMRQQLRATRTLLESARLQ
jgi:hypothetical protein